MTNAWRLPVMAAAVMLGCASAASAQSVMVRHLPPGSAVEAVINTGPAISGTANQDGDVTLVFPASTPLGPGGKAEMDANVFLDTCKAVHRVVIFDRAKTPPPAADDCDRREITGVFWVRRVNTLVVDTATSTPSLLLIKGKYVPPPPPKPESASGEDETQKPRRKSPVGPMIFGGGGLGTYSAIAGETCGLVSPCSTNQTAINGTAGIQFWMKEWLGIEGSYLRPKQFNASGGDTFTFNTGVTADIYSVNGLVGAPLGLVRPYAKGGVNFTASSSTTVETIDVSSQTIAFKTRGWGYAYGGGVDVTIGKRIIGFAEVDFLKLNGGAVGGGPAQLDDKYTAIVIGARLQLTK